MNAKRLSASGFTLVEVMVSLSMMAIAFVALWGLHYSSLHIEMENRHEREALELAKCDLETLRVTTRPGRIANADLVVAPGGGDAYQMVNPTIDYRLVRTVTIPPPRPWENQVDVVVSWTELGKNIAGSRINIPRRVQLSTVIVNLP